MPVSLEVECIDRMYLNGCVPGLQTEGGFIHFIRQHWGFPIASTAVVAPMSKSFVQSVEAFAQQPQLDVVAFEKPQRKDEVTQQYLARADFTEGVLYIGKAQEKASGFRTTHQRHAESGQSYPGGSAAARLYRITIMFTFRTKTADLCWPQILVCDEQRASALSFGDPRSLVLMQALCWFQLLFEGFRNGDLRNLVAPLSNQDPATLKPGRLTYDLRRLRLHGLIERQPRCNRYRVTAEGIRISLFYIRAQERFFRVGLAIDSRSTPGRATRTLVQAGKAIDKLIEKAKLAASNLTHC
ncbi:MAG: hypothetical protein ACRERV_06015 [Methylococcales bacterium]